MTAWEDGNATEPYIFIVEGGIGVRYLKNMTDQEILFWMKINPGVKMGGLFLGSLRRHLWVYENEFYQRYRILMDKIE